MISPEELNYLIPALQPKDAIELCEYQLEAELRQKIGPLFKKSISRIYDQLLLTRGVGSVKHCLDTFVKAVDDLYREVEKFWTLTRARDPNGRFRAKSIGLTKALIFHLLWDELRVVVKFAYEKTFAAFCQTENRGKVPLANPEDGPCDVCEKNKTKCECWFWMVQFRRCNEKLLELELLDRLAGITVIEIARFTIEKKVKAICVTPHVQHLDRLNEWYQSFLLKWLYEIYVFSDSKRKSQSTTPRRSQNLSFETPNTSSTSNPPTVSCESSNFDGKRREQFEKAKIRLTQYLYDSYGNYLINRLFEIIVEYPESKPALADLKFCMSWVQLRQRLTDRLRESLERRLLHPGVNTSDILSAYIQTVYTLRFLDPSGVLMENVCQPVRQYLRQRNDTVRCIVSYLTDNGGLEMNSSVLSIGDASLSFNDSGAGATGETTTTSGGESKTDDDWMDWRPDPIDAAPESMGRAKRSADVISMLVGVYGSREQFVKEYCQLLAERLLRSQTYTIDDELRYLELLKLRIGEAELNQCEVMLKDVRDSQRIDSFVNSQESMKKCPIPVQALILSSYFWPTLKEERLELPERIKSALEVYSTNFQLQKASRTLDWKTNLGIVELELELGGRVIPVHATPMLAAIIIMFEKKGTWTADELSTELKVSPNVLKRRIGWWTGVEIIKEISNDVFQLCTDLPPTRHRRLSCGIEDDDDDDGEAATSEATDKVEQLETYWPYIMGLLTSFDDLAAERIHSLLRMFSTQGNEPTLDTVHRFLQRKVRDGLLTYSGGVYKLQKKSAAHNSNTH